MQRCWSGKELALWGIQTGSAVVKSPGTTVKLPGFESQLCLTLTVWLWMSYTTSLDFGFLIYTCLIVCEDRNCSVNISLLWLVRLERSNARRCWKEKDTILWRLLGPIKNLGFILNAIENYWRILSRGITP